LLKNYLEKCKFKNSLAFMQFRSLVDKNPKNHAEINEIFYGRTHYLRRVLTKVKDLSKTGNFFLE
jgi:hypothetical protein